jgi:hypothetical protein
VWCGVVWCGASSGWPGDKMAGGPGQKMAGLRVSAGEGN